MSKPLDSQYVAEPAWLTWARALQALAQTGLHFSRDPFDIQRYEEVRAIATAMLAAGSGEPTPRILDLFRQDTGYTTPKIGVRGAAFRDGRILLVRERDDGRWSLPGGWADVNQSAAQCVEREFSEEAGFTARATKLVAVWDRGRHVVRPFPFSIYGLYFLCTLTGGSAQPGIETTEVEFFAEDQLPELSDGRVTERMIGRMFAHQRHPDLPTEFD
jgi:ADP-ribose pyrophosphatase YjhB (NUDIX family)